MTIEEQFWTLEDRLWTDDAAFLRNSLHRKALLVFPDPTGTLTADRAIAALEGSPRWDKVTLSNRHANALGNGVVSLAYDAVAETAQETYPARCSSVYVTSAGRWRLVHHHQARL